MEKNVYYLFCGGMSPVTVEKELGNKTVIRFDDGNKKRVKTRLLIPASDVSQEAKRIYGKHAEGRS